MENKRVCIYKTDKVKYPNISTLFRPSVKYPEYKFKVLSSENNSVYEAVRECFHLQGLDEKNYGTEEWNPLSKIIKQGDTVLIKPNLVMDKNALNGDTECLYTQPSVVASVIDYVLLALGNSGKIVIGDAPMQECDFQKLIEDSGYQVLVDFYIRSGYDVSLVDFRELTSKVVNGVHISTINENSQGTVIDLGEYSEFYQVDADKLKRMRITNYNPEILLEHHNNKIHEYYISDYILSADVIINMPKPKSHRKAGATIALKNFVGVNIRKEYLPHHTKGSISEGGDEYDKESSMHSIRSNLYDVKNRCESQKKYKRARIFKYLIRGCSLILKLEHNKYSEGSWYGNDTINKTVSDINKIVYYADKNGMLQDNVQRKVLIVADMIKAGEGEGPILPSSKECGVIAIGSNPVYFDKVISSLMGFDYKKIPTIMRAASIEGKYRIYDKQEARLTISNEPSFNNKTAKQLQSSVNFDFKPTSGWRGHIESTII